MNYRIGYVPLTIEHKRRGDKNRGGYMSCCIFIKHGFDPLTDLRRSSYGVLEVDGNKPELEREFDCYLRARQEDANTTA